MSERQIIDHELSAIEIALKELETRFEQYLAGVEKRAPMLARDRLAQRLRKFGTRQIIQTDLRFRYQNLATRFHTYYGHWDRILRQVEEGRRVRPVVAQKCQNASREKPSPPPRPSSTAHDEVEEVYRQLVAAREAAPSGGALPDRVQLRAFLEKQRSQIVERFGDREVEFIVEIDKDRPRIKVRAKR